MIDSRKYGVNAEKYREILESVTPLYAGAVFAREELPFALAGEDIRLHLGDCGYVLVCAATLGAEFDRVLRQLQVVDMSGAVVLDLMSGDFLEEFCDRRDRETVAPIAASGERSARFSPGYGDFPLSVNREILAVLGASTKIGLCATPDFVLTPQKSITGLVPVWGKLP